MGSRVQRIEIGISWQEGHQQRAPAPSPSPRCQGPTDVRRIPTVCLAFEPLPLLGKNTPISFPPASMQDPDPQVPDKGTFQVPLEGTLSLVPGTELPSKKWKTYDKETLPYF
ncbi:hypothetical protein F2Q69_00048442 [Brassica cretica]|uniref:Uncharacterized protein n=1 Tax=Brassica cretica TaxID=69181 RepID=A0A8S9PRL6_BRACR|nr:hypothetical protein F2Q69_00048442 [Brassica cretica]